MKRSAILLLLPVLCQAASSQVIFSEPASVRQTGYTIDAQLDTRAAVVNASMNSFWVNRSGEDVSEVQMHMYLNAFRNEKSTFLSEPLSRRMRQSPDSGWIEIDRLVWKGRDIKDLIRFISPDDGNPDDRTVVSITLPEPCKPGDTVIFDIGFRSGLPSSIVRTGHSGDFFFVAQWFPKFGVYETPGMRYATDGTWNCHQFHSNSEFYANHSVYDVKITVPSEYTVGSCGLLLSESPSSDSTKMLHYRAEDIVDFAWTAWPGYAVHEEQWKHVKIRLLLPAEREKLVARHMQAAKYALEYLDTHVGPYPWPYLTVVDPPAKGAGAGGMEYTTMITSMSLNGLPGWVRFPEVTTIHEFIHSYFMGILANNEFEEPWLDEGITSYWEWRIADYVYKYAVIDLPYLKISNSGSGRQSYVRSPLRQAADNSLYSWQYPHGTYGMMSYNKAATVFKTLEGVIGTELMDSAFREYYRRWAFRHPSGKDLINVVNEVVSGAGQKFGPDLNWFFDQTLYGTGICDYKVIEIDNKSVPEMDSVYHSVVTLGRVGEVKLPVEVLIHFEDGTEITERWDGISRTKEFKYTGASRVTRVHIDPNYLIAMDVDHINNSRAEDATGIPVRRIRNKLIAFLQVWLSIILI